MLYFAVNAWNFLVAISPVLKYLCGLTFVLAPWIVLAFVIVRANRIRAHCTEQVGAEIVSARVCVGKHTYCDYGHEKYRVGVRYSYNGDTYTVELQDCIPKKALNNARETGLLYIWVDPRNPRHCCFKD